MAEADRLTNRLFKIPGGCWHWTGAHDKRGYGALHVAGVLWKAHRLAYQVFYGVAPGRQHVLHSCDVRDCCNPAHLRLADNQANVADKVARERQTRGSQHPFAKLDEDTVAWARNAPMSGRAVARVLGVSSATIGSLRRKETWKHV